MKSYIKNSRKIGEQKSHWLLGSISAIVVVVIVFGCVFKESNTSTPNRGATITTAEVTQSEEDKNSDADAGATFLQDFSETYPVTKVTDGDTIWVDINGTNTKIRLIGVNTPETVSTSTPVQCYGPEASAYAKAMLINKMVALEKDESQGDLDKYGRALRYVYVDGENFNYLLIANGFGFEYTYQAPYKYQGIFKAAEATAKNSRAGLWSPTTCNGELTIVTAD